MATDTRRHARHPRDARTRSHRCGARTPRLCPHSARARQLRGARVEGAGVQGAFRGEPGSLENPPGLASRTRVSLRGRPAGVRPPHTWSLPAAGGGRPRLAPAAQRRAAEQTRALLHTRVRAGPTRTSLHPRAHAAFRGGGTGTLAPGLRGDSAEQSSSGGAESASVPGGADASQAGSAGPAGKALRGRAARTAGGLGGGLPRSRGQSTGSGEGSGRLAEAWASSPDSSRPAWAALGWSVDL